jgi:cold shock CspA family protein
MLNRIMPTSTVTATVEGVLPEVGLAYLAGDDHRDWTVTRSTRGIGLESLKTGQRVNLTVEQHRRFAVVREYAAAP